MFSWLSLLVLLSLMTCARDVPVPLSGKEGDTVTFPCDSGTENYTVTLKAGSKNVFGGNQDKEYVNRAFENGGCSIKLEQLKRSDAGLYTLFAYESTSEGTSDQLFIKTYLVSIKDEISVKTGENLTLKVVFHKTEKVVHQTISGEKTVWIKGKGAQRDRLTENNEDLIISGFITNDSGIYRALDSGENTLITVNVTENVTASGKESIQDNTTLSTGLIVGVIVSVGVLIVILAVPATRTKITKFLRTLQRWIRVPTNNN